MFFDTFSELCRKKGISPKAAVTEIGLSNSIATKWKKTAATPQGDTLDRIADYFGVTVDSLLGKEKPANDGLKLSNEEIKAAFWGGDKDLSQKDIDELWDDVRDYAKYKAEQKKRKK